ncbi:MAG: ATP-binding protein [Bacteroidota bacterium]|nr:ATP-binding protein [Bacteroidota bacterium]
MVISSSLNNINNARLFLEEVFAEYNLDHSYFNHVFLGLSEALTNSIVHGNKLNILKKICIEIKCVEKELFIEVTDEGDGFSADSLKDPTSDENLKKENGRGVFLIRRYADELDYFDGGRKVRIKYNFN